MNILQRYIIRELAWPVLMSILFFSFILLLRQLFRFAEMLLEAGVGFGMFLQIVFIVTITLMIITIPMAALMGCMIGISRLTNENEILAMRVSGLSLGKLFLPVFAAAAIGSAILMWSGFDLLPSMIRRLTDKSDELTFQVLTNLEPGRNYDDLSPKGSKIGLFFEKVMPKQPNDGPFTLRMSKVALRVEGDTGGLTGANIRKSDDKDAKKETLFFANEGIIKGELQDRRVTITLGDGTVVPVNREDTAKEIRVQFETLNHVISPGDAQPTTVLMDPRQMTLAELREATTSEPATAEFYSNPKRKTLSPEWNHFLTARNELFQRFTLPWSLLAFVLIAVPLAVELRPRAKTLAFFISISLIITYYVMNTLAGAIGTMQGSSYAVTLFFYLLPNLLIGGAGVFLFWRSQR
ncbi:LptF/LptG family permease [Candidatus Sumerlaeota bacterium]|nr:LptF/LptG family permease [Candidatus Sumerlaeota bacterium]